MQGQPPGVISTRRGGRQNQPGPLLVVRHDSGVVVAQGDHDRARERREVDEVRRSLPAGVRERVGEHEPSLGVGVRDLDRLAVERGHDVAGPVRPPARHVLAGRHDREHAQRKPELRDRPHGRDDGTAAGHVAFHLLHAGGGLDRDTAGVERDRLADEAEDDALHGVLGLVAEDDQAGLRLRALGDGGERAHAGRLDLGPAPDLDREAAARRDLAGTLGKRGRRELVGGGVDELATAVGPVRGYPCSCGRLGGGASPGSAEDETLDRRSLAVPRLPAAGVVGAEDGAVHDRPCLFAGGKAQPRFERPRDRSAAESARSLDDAGRRGAESVRVQAGRLADPDRRQAVRSELAERVHEREVAELALDLAILGQMGETAGEQAVELRTHLPQRRGLGDGESEDVRLDRLGRRVDDGDLHLQPAHGSRRGSYPGSMPRTGGKPFDELMVPAQGSRPRVDTKERMDDRADSASSSQPVGALDGQPPLPVEALQELLGGLVLEREELRRMGADRSDARAQPPGHRARPVAALACADRAPPAWRRRGLTGTFFSSDRSAGAPACWCHGPGATG